MKAQQAVSLYKVEVIPQAMKWEVPNAAVAITRNKEWE
jgi:hypothetical protein